jgi:hypothetical protein
MTGGDGKLYAADSLNQLWVRDPVAANINWTYIGYANNVVGLAYLNGKLYAADSSHRLYVRDPVPNVDWVHIGHANNVVAMAAGGGKLYAADSANNLWSRDPVPWNVNWTHIGYADDIVGLTYANGKLFAANRQNRLLVRATPPPPPVVLVGSTGTVKVYDSHYAFGGSCYASATATWNRSTNRLTVNSTAWSTAPFDGCKVRITANANVGSVNVASVGFDVPTACSTWDPTCPSMTQRQFTVPWFVQAPWLTAVSSLSLGASAR